MLARMAPTPRHRVALLGFSDFERGAMASCLRLSDSANAGFELVESIDAADLIVVDADHADEVARVELAGRLADAVVIGDTAPAGAAACAPRPIEPGHLLRELEGVAHLRHLGGPMWPPEQAVIAAPVPAPATLPPIAPSGPRALLVDDSSIALRYLERQLQRQGLQTACARNSQEARHCLGRDAYRFVFIDVELGADSELNGLALCHQIQAAAGAGDRPHLVLVSAHQAETDRFRGTLAGCDAYLGKPFREAELRRALAPSRPAR